MAVKGRQVCGAVLGMAALLFVDARAQPAADSQALPDPVTGTPQNPVPGPAEGATGTGPSPGQPGWAANLGTTTNLLGSLYGARTLLGNYGISLGLQETSELFGNATGGIRRGVDYNGLTTLSLGLDTAKAFGWEGGTFNVSAFQIHGRSLSTDNLLVLQNTSSIQAQRATRLWELWYQQAFLGGKLDVKVGQQSLDTEFITSSYAGTFINAAMGWPFVPALDLYAGGPAYPLSSLGVRLRAQPFENVTVLGGVFDDNPPGGPFFDDSQVRGASQSGTRFNLGTGALWIGEVQYALNPAPASGTPTPGAGLPGVYKLGAWYDSGTFYDQFLDTAGNRLQGPLSNGQPRPRRGNWSIYATMDQMVWRPAADSPRSVGVFLRLMGAPGDRNASSFAANGGVVLKAPLPGRDGDSVGLGFGVISLSPGYVPIGQGTGLPPAPARTSESFLELTYQYQATPWLTLQPDFQYVFNPGGGIQNPLRPSRRVGDAAVFGIRTNIVF